MNVAFRRAMTVNEYLAWSESHGEQKRTELINGQIVPLPPEHFAHTCVKAEAVLALDRAVAAAHLPCEVMTNGVAVQIDEYTAYEPDAFVYCGECLRPETMIVPSPIIIVEVLSPATRHSDRSAKLIGYFKLPSVAHYLVLDPDARTVIHHVRDGVPTLLTSGPLRLDPPGLNLTVDDLLGPA